MGTELALSSRAAERRLWIALSVSLLIVIVELFGGLLGQSLALLSDSAHVLTDVLTIGIAILTLRLGRSSDLVCDVSGPVSVSVLRFRW